ncbi:MAG: precorrin-8X methylmutase [Pseudomonadota bacterium]
MALDYLRDPAAIYRQSFATIRNETDLAGLSNDEAAIATRVMHACGMTDVVASLTFRGDVAAATRNALANGKAVLTDVEMVRSAIMTRHLPDGSNVICRLNDERTPDLAKQLTTTRSAAAVSLWQDDLDGAVVVIGNAPTALFALLEMIDTGGPKPAALFAFPVGFVGAVESKDELLSDHRGLNFVTLTGRRGGSAIAAAAFNATLIGARDQ